MKEVVAAVKVVEAKHGKSFGSPANPLFFSCRSGARLSMPGMMDTARRSALATPPSL
jgi:pyruvate,orthophosphate dikinase